MNSHGFSPQLQTEAQLAHRDGTALPITLPFPRILPAAACIPLGKTQNSPARRREELASPAHHHFPILLSFSSYKTTER